MKVYYGLDEFNKGGEIVATIGTFDGVHIGHKKLLKNLVAHGKICQAESLLLTFFPQSLGHVTFYLLIILRTIELS